MILRNALIPTALLALLAACGGNEGPPSCSAAPSSPTADTLIGAMVDGRQVLIPTAGSWGGAFYDTTAVRLTVTGQSSAEAPEQRFQVAMYGFYGVGTYPAQLVQDPGTANAFYWCQDVTDQAYEAQGVPGDRVTVTSYDTLTGEISGTFAFHGYGATHGDTLLVTFGTFHAFAVKE